MLIEEFAELIINHENRIRRLEKREGYIVGSLQEVQDQVTALVHEDGVVVSALNDLKAKVDAGGNVTSADLDGLRDSLAAEVSKLSDAVNSTDPGVDQPDSGPVNVSPNPSTQPDAGTDTPTDTTAPSDAPTTTPAAPDAGPTDMTGPAS